MAEFNVDAKQVQTNMVFAELDKRFDVNHLTLLLSQQGILISATYSLRFVTHKDISRQDVLTFIDALKKCLPQARTQ